MELHLNEIQRYRNFVELKALDYAMLYDTLLEDEAKLTPELVEIYEQRFAYWNRKPVEILRDILAHYERLEITKDKTAVYDEEDMILSTLYDVDLSDSNEGESTDFSSLMTDSKKDLSSLMGKKSSVADFKAA